MEGAEIRPFHVILNELYVAEAGRLGVRKLPNSGVAAALEVGQAQVSLLRKGKREASVNTVLAVAEFFDVHPAYFVGGRRDRAPGSLPRRSFATKLNVLFRLVHPPDAPELTTHFIARRVNDHGIALKDPKWSITRDTIADLRDGTNTNPKLRYLPMLAQAFGAPPAFFLDEDLASRIETQLKQHKAITGLGIDTVIARLIEDHYETEGVVIDAVLAALRKASCQLENLKQRKKPSTAHGEAAEDGYHRDLA